jgi:peptidyl-prolyl cis-trans isomerase D
MLDSLRGAAKSWIAKILLGLLAISFVAWGIGDVFRSGFTGNAVMSSGDTRVSPIEYRLAYNRQVQVYSQQLRQNLSREQAKALGIEQQVMAQLTAGVVLDEQARKMNLGLSQERLAALTADDPAFRDSSGKFSRTNFDAVLRNVGMRAEDYLQSRQSVAVRQQIVEAVADGVKLPDVYLEAMAVHTGESRDVDYIKLPVSLVQPIPEPTDAELTKFFDERKDSYKAPEYRKFSYVKLTPEDIADTKAIDDAAAKADYDKNIARYTKAEARKIEQLVFADKQAAAAAKAEMANGATFEDLVKGQNKTMTDVLLGDLRKTELPDQKIADAAFALAANAVSEPVEGQFGPVLLRVTQITPAAVESFDAVKEQIRTDIALSEANNVLLESHDAYEDARGGGDSMQAAAQKTKLKMVTVEAADASGLTPSGEQVKDLPEAAALLAAVFAADQGVENTPINAGSNGFLWYETNGVTAERERPLSEVKAKVAADWKTAQGAERLATKAAALLKEVQGGKTLDLIATDLKLAKETKRGLKRGVDDPDFDGPTIEAAFGGGKDYAALAAGGSGDLQILMKVIETYDPTDATAAAIGEAEKKQKSSQLSDDLLDQLVSRLQGDFPVTINQSLIDQSINAN